MARHNSLSERLILVLLFASLLVSSAYAADENLSVNTYVVHSEPYTPYQVFIITLALGLSFLILSLILSKEQNAEVFAALSIIPLFAASWMALQIDIPVSGIISMTNDTSSVIRTEHNIYPAVVLATILFFIALISVFQTYRLITMDTGISGGTSDYYNDNYPEDD